MARMQRIFGIVLLIAVVAIGGFSFYQQRDAVVQSTTSTDGSSFTQLVTVEQGSISASISVVGALESVQQADLSFDQLSGVADLLTLAVSAGTTVEAGQVLATIDPAAYEQVLTDAQSTLDEANQTLADLQTPPTELQLAQNEQSVAQAELNLKQALTDLADLQKPADVSALQANVQSALASLNLAQIQQPLVEHDSLAKSERDLQYAIDWNQRRYWELKALISAGQANLEQTQELDDVQVTIGQTQADLARVQSQLQLARDTATAKASSAQAAVADAQAVLYDAQGGATVLSVAAAQVAVQKASVAAQLAWEARTTLESGPDPAKLASAQAAVTKALQSVTDAQENLTATSLTAPFAGTVLQAQAVVGDRITVNSIILTLADLAQLQVVAAVDETTIRQVQAGQPVQISFDAFPGQAFTGQVLSVPLQGELQGGVMIYQVPISLVGAEELSLLVGMTANANISVGQADNALLLPSMAVQSSRGVYQVLIPAGDPSAQPQAVQVQVGLTNGTYTEIIGGLNVGDQVLVETSASTSTNLFGGGGGGFPGGGGGGFPRGGGG